MNKTFIALLTLVISFNIQPAPRYSELPDSDANILAALIYKLYFYVDYNAEIAVPNYCFVGDKGEQVAQSLRTEKAQGNLKLFIKISHWSRLADIREKQCHLLYSAPVSIDEVQHYKTLSKHTLTISNSTNLKETDNIVAITLTKTGPVLTFSRRNLRRSALQVNSQLIRNSIIRP